MSDLSDLYQEVILDHNKRPRNFGTVTASTCHAHGHNPLCGDRLTVSARVHGGHIEDIQFEGAGCAISKASGSLMTEAVKGRSVTDALLLFDRFHALVTGEPLTEPELESLGKLAALGGVRQFPVRVKCASLAWHTLKAALHHDGRVARTES